MSPLARGWKHRLELADVFHDDDQPFEQRRDEIVLRIKATDWYKAEVEQEEDGELWWTVDEMTDADDEAHFDLCWNAFYDWCDEARVWVATV